MAAITVNCAMTKTGCIHVVNLAAEANNGQVAPSHCHLVAVQNGGRTFTVLRNRLGPVPRGAVGNTFEWWHQMVRLEGTSRENYTFA